VDREGRGLVRVLTRVLLVVFAIQALSFALWGLLTPRGLYDSYPGGGRHWINVLPPYNEHLIRDYAGALLGIGALLVWAFVTMDRRLVQAALVTLALASLPHAIYHLTTTDRFATADKVLTVGGLWLEVLVPAILLYAQRHPAEITGMRAHAPT